MIAHAFLKSSRSSVLSDAIWVSKVRPSVYLLLLAFFIPTATKVRATDVRTFCGGSRGIPTTGVSLSYNGPVAGGYWLSKTSTPLLSVFTVMAATNSVGGADCFFTIEEGQFDPVKVEPRNVYSSGRVRICECERWSIGHNRLITFVGTNNKDFRQLDITSTHREWGRGFDGAIYRLSPGSNRDERLLTRIDSEGRIRKRTFTTEKWTPAQTQMLYKEGSQMAVLRDGSLLICYQFGNAMHSSIYGRTVDSVAVWIIDPKSAQMRDSYTIALTSATHGWIKTDTIPPPQVFEFVTNDESGLSLILAALTAEPVEGADHCSSGVFLLHFNQSGELVRPGAIRKASLTPVTDVAWPIWGYLAQDNLGSSSSVITLMELGRGGEFCISQTRCDR